MFPELGICLIGLNFESLQSIKKCDRNAVTISGSAFSSVYRHVSDVEISVYKVKKGVLKSKRLVEYNYLRQSFCHCSSWYRQSRLDIALLCRLRLDCPALKGDRCCDRGASRPTTELGLLPELRSLATRCLVPFTARPKRDLFDLGALPSRPFPKIPSSLGLDPPCFLFLKLCPQAFCSVSSPPWSFEIRFMLLLAFEVLDLHWSMQALSPSRLPRFGAFLSVALPSRPCLMCFGQLLHIPLQARSSLLASAFMTEAVCSSETSAVEHISARCQHPEAS
jgi:hypothetical protein